VDALFWLAAGALALYAFAFVSLVLRVRGMVLRRPVHRVLPADEVPAWLSTFAAPAVERLTALGFRPFGALASVAMDRQSDDETVDLVFHEPESGTYAFVYLPPTVPGARPLSVDLATWSTEGSLRLTLAQSPGPTHRDVPGTTVVGLPELSLGRRFARHVFETAAMTARTLEPGEMAAELTRRNGAALSAALEAGEVCARPGGVFGHTLLGTARLVGRILQGLLRPGGAGGVFHGRLRARSRRRARAAGASGRRAPRTLVSRRGATAARAGIARFRAVSRAVRAVDRGPGGRARAAHHRRRAAPARARALRRHAGLRLSRHLGLFPAVPRCRRRRLQAGGVRR
jgi:hypothetical protein